MIETTDNYSATRTDPCQKIIAAVPFPILYAKPDGEPPNVLIDDEYRECVCFLCSEIDGGKQEMATGFFIEVFTTPTVSTHYLITARHVIDMSRVDGPLFVKINLNSGGYKYIPVPQDDWFLHPQELIRGMMYFFLVCLLLTLARSKRSR